jgi:hypothetical protein
LKWGSDWTWIRFRASSGAWSGLVTILDSGFTLDALSATDETLDNRSPDLNHAIHAVFLALNGANSVLVVQTVFWMTIGMD